MLNKDVSLLWFNNLYQGEEQLLVGLSEEYMCSFTLLFSLIFSLVLCVFWSTWKHSSAGLG